MIFLSFNDKFNLKLSSKKKDTYSLEEILRDNSFRYNVMKNIHVDCSEFTIYDMNIKSAGNLKKLIKDKFIRIY